MTRANTSGNKPAFVNVPHAKWVIGVLSMLVAVVGKDNLLGLILRQTRCEIRSLIRDEPPPAPWQNN